MAWLGIWFEHEAGEGGARDPAMFQGLVPPLVYPFARSFIEGEGRRLVAPGDPSAIHAGRERFPVYYSLNHDGGERGLSEQGCSILAWLFEHFDPDGGNSLSARFNEIPVVIHAVDPAHAAAMGNALALLRFLGAAEDQAVAKLMLHPWSPLQGSARLAALEYERRALEFLGGGIFYPEGVTLFDVLARRDLRSHRRLARCCTHEIAFVESLLEWADECWPRTPEEARDLEASLRKSLADEARTLRRERRNGGRDAPLA